VGFSKKSGTEVGQDHRPKLLLLAVVVLAGLLWVNEGTGMVGPLSHHMLTHILLMNAMAPVLALLLIELPNTYGGRLMLKRTLVPATFFQIAFLWGWHAPQVLEVAIADRDVSVAMQASLFGAGLWFWATVFATSGVSRWQAIFALLVTGKLSCLLGALLLFAPSAIFELPIASVHQAGTATALVDQQLAGLLMITACPLSYVLVGVVIAAIWLHGLEARDKTFSAIDSS
jgi:putative membrane protein